MTRISGLIALTRFGYGPHGDGDVMAAAADPRGFLESELAQPGIALLSGRRPASRHPNWLIKP